MSEAYERMRISSERTVAERTARVWKANLYEPRDTEPPRARFESAGVVNFITRRASVEHRTSEAQAAGLLRLVEDAAGGRSRDAAWNQEQADDWSQVNLLIDDSVYVWAGPTKQWVRRKRRWWEHPLLPLNLLATVSTTSHADGPSEVRGYATTEYKGTVDPARLKRVDPVLLRKLVGRRSRHTIEVRAWLDENSRAIRVWWTICPASREAAGVSWTATEFWDFGIEVKLTPPSDELVAPPPTFREIGQALRSMRQRAPYD